MSRPLAALTGGTGFLGRAVTVALDRAGWQVRLLVRRYPVHEQLRDVDVELVPGGLEDEAALRQLVRGAELVVHAAGLTKAVDRAQFFAVNAGGSARLAAAIRQAAPGARTIALSSLAARVPSLSAYAASKQAGEAAMLGAGLANPPIILRPTAIYGPWDAELLPFFQAAARGVVPLPGRRPARVTLIHVEDAAGAVAACAGPAGRPGTWEISDARSDGYGWDEVVMALAAALGRPARGLGVPGVLLQATGLAAAAGGRMRRRAVMLTRGKARELLHPDWSIGAAGGLPLDLWQPRLPLAEGFAATAAWYRSKGWLAGAPHRH